MCRTCTPTSTHQTRCWLASASAAGRVESPRARDRVAPHRRRRLACRARVGVDPEACRYQAWGPNTAAQTKAFVAQAVIGWIHQPQSRYVWTAEEQQRVVGLGELRISSREWRQGEIGYVVHLDHWGRGVGRAIARALLGTAFESMNLHRVMATCDPRNLASAAVLQKVGMTF